MNISDNILDYWREASILSILNSSLQSPKLTLLSKDIISSNTIDDIHPSRVYLAPISIQHKDANIYPYFIPCDLSSTGKIDVTGVTSEDILISKALEKVFSGGSDYLLQQLQFSQEEFSSLDEVFLFCTQLLEDIPDIDFKDSKCAIFVHDDLANLVRESLLLKTKTNPHEVYVSMDNELNSYIYLGHTSNKFTLSKQPKDFLNRLHTMMNKQVLLVDAVPGSGALEAVRSFTIDAWVKSAITNSPLPKYYHYDKENVRLSHIFANDDSGWLSYDIQLELVNNTDELDNIESISKSYIKKSNTFFNKQAMTVEEVLRYLHRLLNQQVNKLKEGITLKYIYNEMKTKIDHKYEKHTDINTRKNRLMVYLAAAREELNEVKVLLSFWQRQVSQMPFYYKNLQNMSYVSKKFLKRFKSYFSKHIVEEKFNNMLIPEVETELTIIIKKFNKKVYKLEEHLKQCELDSHQNLVARNKYGAWLRMIGTKENCSDLDLESFLDITLRYDIYRTAVRFWEGMFLNGFIFDTNMVDDEYMLFVDSAQLVNSSLLINKVFSANKVVLINRPGRCAPKQISDQIDEMIANKHQILTDDFDYYELQCQGLSMSNGNIWRFYADAVELEDILNMSQTYMYSKAVANMLNKFEIKTESLSNVEGEIGIVPVPTTNISFINRKEAKAIEGIVDYIKNDKVVVVTTTSAQCELISKMLGPNVLCVTDNELQEMNMEFDTVICSLVFSDKSQFKPFETKEFWQRILVVTKNNLHIVADPSLFKSAMHTSMGCFMEHVSVTENHNDKAHSIEMSCI